MEGGLERFVLAQGLHFETALAEIRGGKKMTHWSWFVFPILEYFVDGRRGGSAQTQLYGLRGTLEVDSFLSHPVQSGVLSKSGTRGLPGGRVDLRRNLLAVLDAVTGALLGTTIVQLVGPVDAVKVAMCASCFLSGGQRLRDQGVIDSCTSLLLLLGGDPASNGFRPSSAVHAAELRRFENVIRGACASVSESLDSQCPEGPAALVARGVEVTAVGTVAGWNGVAHGGTPVRLNGNKFPPWYLKLLAAATHYPFVREKFGLHVGYNGAGHRAEGWKFLMTGDVLGPGAGVLPGWLVQPRSLGAAEFARRLAALRGFATEHSCSSFGELDERISRGTRWSGQEGSTIRSAEGEFVLGNWPGDPTVRSVKGEVVLDGFLRHRDTAAAGALSDARSVAGEEPASTPYSVVRSVSESQYDRLVTAGNRDLALRAAANIGTAHRDVYVYCDMEGTDVGRNFTTKGWGSTGCTLLRDRDNCFGVRVAGEDGRLFDDADYNRVRRLWDSDFAAVLSAAKLAGRRSVVLPLQPLGTTDGKNGLRETAPRLFQLLMHHLVKLLKGASNKEQSTVLDVNGAGYREFQGGSSVRSLREMSLDPHVAEVLLPATAEQGAEEKLRDMDIALGGHVHARVAWVAREAASVQRRAGGVDSVVRGGDGATIRKQFPTFTAPLSMEGLKSYQAGPLTCAQVSNQNARVLWDSGCTSSFDGTPWVMIQPSYAEKIGAVVDTSKQFRVAAVDGNRVNTVGTTDILLQFPRQAPIRVEARVLDVNDPEWDVLIGHTWMILHNVSLDNSQAKGAAMGVRFANGAMLEYSAPYDSAVSDVKLFRMASRDGKGLGRGHVRRRSVSNFGTDEGKVRERLQEKRECERLKYELRQTLARRLSEDDSDCDDAPDEPDVVGLGSTKAPPRRQAGARMPVHGEVWRPDGSGYRDKDNDDGEIVDDLMFTDGPGGNPDSAYSAETEAYLRLARDGSLPQGDANGAGKVEMFYWEDVPDEERLLMDPNTHSNASWVAASLQMEQSMPVEQRLVTRLMKTDPYVAVGGELNMLAFIRKVESYASVEDKRKLGEWASSIAPDAVMKALDATSYDNEEVKVTITAADGSSTIENWLVKDVKTDLLDVANGRILGPTTTVEGVWLDSRKGIFDDENPGRVVSSEKPFNVDIKSDYKDGTKKPWFTYRRVPPALKNVLEEWVRECIRKGILIPFKSSFASPIFAVAKSKKNPQATEEEEATRYRFVCDLRQANAATVEERYPNPSCTETFDCLTADKQVYSSLDLASAFFQCRVSEDLYPYLAFMTHGISIEETRIEQADGSVQEVAAGHYASFTHARLPQGSSWSPQAFQAMLDRTCSKHLPAEYGTEVLSFVDDLAICTDTVQRHMDVLQLLFTALAADGWTLSPSKTKLFSRSIQFLGLVVSCENKEKSAMLYGDRGKVQVVLDLPTPKDVSELRGFLGATNYYRTFIKNYASIADPLVKLTRKNTIIRNEWAKEHDDAFAALKLALGTAGAVTPFNPNLEIVIQCDAARAGCGSVLQQVYNGALRPVAFFSKQYREPAWQYRGPDAPLEGPGSNKPAMVLELRGLVETCMHFKKYLDGNSCGVRLLSDHSSLTSLKDMAAKGMFTGQIQRWVQFLAGLEAKIQWKAGATMHVSDYLSRYSHHETGMKPTSELLAEMTTDAADVSVFDDEVLDRCTYGGADKLLGGVGIEHVLPRQCPEAERVFKGRHIGTFLRLTRASYNTGLCDVEGPVVECHRLDRGVDDEAVLGLGAWGEDLFEYDENDNVRGRPNRTIGVRVSKGFTDLWEPEGLSHLRDNMRYEPSSTEGKVQRVLSEGLSDLEAEKLGVLHAKEPYNLNKRGELEVYDPQYGYAVVIPEGRADIFRAVAQWHHNYDHPSADQQLGVLRRRFYWRSPADMRRVVNEVCGQCPDCTARKRSTQQPYHVPSPLECGGRPFSVISVDPKPMDVTDIDTGYDSLLVVTCRFSGYTVAIPHYVTDDAGELGRLLGRHVFEVFGVPTVILSDHERNFESASFSSAMEAMGCRLELGTPYHYRTSGGVEIRVKALQDALNQRCHRTKGQHWVAELSKALYSVNKVENPRTKLSPFSILYGYRPTSPLDFLRHDSDFDRQDWDFDEALHAYLVQRDSDRGAQRDVQRARREKAEGTAASGNRSRPEFGVGGWVMLHKKAFGPGGAESKLVSREALGPFRVTKLLPHGRIQVELDKTRYTKGKINVFNLGQVRKFFQRRPWGHDQIALAEHIATPWSGDAEFEVDEVVGRKFTYGKYKYSVSFKGRSGDHSKYLPRDSDRLTGCQKMLDAYDAQFPLGSLRSDEASDKRVYDEARKAVRKSGRLTNRRVNLRAELDAVLRRSGGQEDAAEVANSGTSTRDFHEFTRANKLQRRKLAVARRVQALTTGRSRCDEASTVTIEEVFDD